jgi:cellulose synthase/poly-beta-1,6-N-acetylglucosamine synthase-like glycosyltransferase
MQQKVFSDVGARLGESPNTTSARPVLTHPTTVSNTSRPTEVIRYAKWLSAENRRRDTAVLQEERRKYTEEALRTIMVEGKELSPFAPFRQTFSAYKTLTRGQVVVLSLIALAIALGLVWYRLGMAIAIIAVVTLFYLSTLIMDFVLTLRAINRPIEEQIDDNTVHALASANWPRYTILCPLYREVAVVPQFVEAMQALNYPVSKLQILFLTEEDDAETRKAIAEMHLPSHFSIITVPAGSPRTKPRACNYGLLQATGDYVVIYDAEDVPDPLQLKKAVLTFANHGADLACVQAKLNYYNASQNLLTRWFTVEYSLWFGLTLLGLQQSRLPLPLGGTSNHFRMQALRRVGAWDPFNVTEDCDLGLRLAAFQLKTVVLDSITYEEANSQVKNWIRQRSRWIKGYMQTYLVHMRQPLRYLRGMRLLEFLSLQLIIGWKTGVLLINPLVWILLILYIIFRPVDIYHTLFPTPILYMGTLCLIFGNFFYTYTHLIGCMKLTRYNLIPWAFLIPVYWLMMSCAAYMALFQLIFKPHYWEKTKHGLHLQKTQQSPDHNAAPPNYVSVKVIEEEDEDTMKLPVLLHGGVRTGAGPGHTQGQGMLHIHTGMVPAHLSGRSTFPQWLKDPWLLATFLLACIASFTSCWYFLQQHQILLYKDAISHVRIARRVFDNNIPGVSQLGGIWLPLPHVLMLPFVWNDYLWRTGLAGSFSSMMCYLVAAIYLFRSARRLTHSNSASFVGTLAFILNPNALYLQSTPLSELVCVAMTVIACYYFLAWVQEDHPKYLIGMAAGTFLTSLSRYDGWGLFPVFCVLLVVTALIKRQSWQKIQGILLIFGSLGSLGIILWLLWDAIIFGDPLYWHHYLFGGKAADTRFYTYHDLWQSISAYTMLSMSTIGPLLLILGFTGAITFVLRQRLTSEMIGGIAFLTPYFFYILIFFIGQDTIYLPGIGPATIWHYMWNVRFGVETVAPVALFVAVLVKLWSPRNWRSLWGFLQPMLFVGMILVQTVVVAHSGIVSLQDGLYGDSCLPTERITIFLAQHYAGGKILEDVNAFPIHEADIGIHLKDAVYEGSGPLWDQALKNPYATVDWIIAQPKVENDLIATHINLKSPVFLSQFHLEVEQRDGLTLYHKIGGPPLPTRPVPSSLYTDHRLCSR